MDNNLDGTRLNPIGTTSGQNKREVLPPLPTESPATQMYGPAQMTGAPPIPGFPPAAGMPAASGYPATAGFPSGGFPSAVVMPSPMQGMGQPPVTQAYTGILPGQGGYGAQSGITPLTPFNQPIPVTTENIMYLNAFLRTMIGRRVTVDFLIGTNTIQDRTGTLLAVGANYIVLNEVETDDILTCDFYSIKFVRIYY